MYSTGNTVAYYRKDVCKCCGGTGIQLNIYSGQLEYCNACNGTGHHLEFGSNSSDDYYYGYDYGGSATDANCIINTEEEYPCTYTYYDNIYNMEVS